MGDQFIAIAAGRTQPPDETRHIGLVGDDRRPSALALAEREGRARSSPPGSLDFRDPWGNNVQVVDYREIQFTKAPTVLARRWASRSS